MALNEENKLKRRFNRKVFYVKLHIPPEPVGLRELAFMAEVKSEGFDCFSLHTLHPAYLPSYLWRYWGNVLRREGINWQLFLRLVCSQKENVYLWVIGKASWEWLIKRIRDALVGVKLGILPATLD